MKNVGYVLLLWASVLLVCYLSYCVGRLHGEARCGARQEQLEADLVRQREESARWEAEWRRVRDLWRAEQKKGELEVVPEH